MPRTTRAFVDETGRLQLRPDPYGHNRDGVVAFPEKGLPPLAQRAPVTDAASRETAMGDVPAPL